MTNKNNNHNIDNVEHDIIDLTITDDDDTNTNKPVIEMLGDSADSDAANFTMDHVLPNELEGDIEDVIMTDMPRSYGVQSFQEETFYPESNRRVSRSYNKK